MGFVFIQHWRKAVSAEVIINSAPVSTHFEEPSSVSVLFICKYPHERQIVLLFGWTEFSVQAALWFTGLVKSRADHNRES